MGARPLSRKIDEVLRVPLSKKILFERIKDSTILASLVDNSCKFDIQKKLCETSVHVGEDGIIRI